MELKKAQQSLDKAVVELKTIKERADKVNTDALKLKKLVEGAEMSLRCHVWRLLCVKSLTYFTHLLGLRKALLFIVSLPCFCNPLSVF